MGNDVLIHEFGRRWQALGGFFARADSSQALIECIREAWDVMVVPDGSGRPTVVYWPNDGETDLPWIDALPADMMRWESSAAMRGITEQAALGITGCAWAVAATGSVALYSTPGTGLLPSLLPPAHLVLVRAKDVVATVAEGLVRVTNVRMPNMIKIVTGPSMTADIEGTLVRGVHGPGKVGAVVYDL